jgi:hypothetical protein
MRRHHARRCASSGLPSAAPLSQRTNGDQTRSSHSAALEAAPTRAQDSLRRPARSKIRQDDHQLRVVVHHNAMRSLEQCDTIVNRLPLAY